MSTHTRPRRIAIIGAGPGGICAAIKLRDAGFDDFVIFERAADVGGTWQNNTYPGLECDVQTHLYSFSFEVKKDWSRPYARQPEILEYVRSVVDKYELMPYIRLNTGIRGAYWDEECHLWRVITEHGDEYEFDIVISAVGLFNTLSIPDFEGLDAFAGTTFHSGKWNHDHDLRGRNVAVIGTAASCVQFLPEIAAEPEHLYVFQRTANWVLPKDDAPFTDEQVADFRDDPIAARQRRWMIWRRVEGAITYDNPDSLAAATELGLKNLESVDDPEVRAKLTPHVPYGSQRPLSSNLFYPTFNRDNVELVTDAIERFTPDAVITADGTARKIDTVIFATGYKTGKFCSSIDITGRNAVSLSEAWREGAQAYLGITTAGFPNLFMLYGPNTNNGSIIYMLECQVDYIVRHLQRLDHESITWMDVRRDVQQTYNEQIQADCNRVEVWQAISDSYYRGSSDIIVTQWPHTMTEYRRRTSIDDADAFEVYEGAPLVRSGR
jgi:cation diffusion facilitator CzcD-associated flavoprotein CzcO